MTFTPQLSAFLNTIRFSELGQALIDKSDQGFNVLVGSTPDHMLLFPTLTDGSPDYSTHPNIYNEKMNSTAAGAYQLLHRWYEPYCRLLDLSDFSPISQQAIAAQQIKECKAISFIEAGHIQNALFLCSRIWASLPGSTYGQHTNKLADLEEYFVSQGGFISGSRA